MAKSGLGKSLEEEKMDRRIQPPLVSLFFNYSAIFMFCFIA